MEVNTRSMSTAAAPTTSVVDQTATVSPPNPSATPTGSDDASATSLTDDLLAEALAGFDDEMASPTAESTESPAGIAQLLAEDTDAPADPTPADTQDPDDTPPAEADPTAEEAADPEEEAEDPADPDAEALPEKVQARIDTLVAMKDKFREQRDSARNEAEDLREQVARLEAGAVTLTPTERNPLSDLTDPAAVRKRITDADAVIRWADQHPDGCEVKGTDGQTVYFDADEVRNRRLQAERVKEIHGPKRLEYLDRHREAVAVAKQTYPDLFQADTWQSANADQFLNANPSIMENPLWPVIAGDWLMGAAARSGMFKLVPVNKPGTPAKAAPAATAKAPAPAAPAPEPPPTPSSTTPPRASANRLHNQRASDAFIDSGGTDDEALLAIAESLLS